MHTNTHFSIALFIAVLLTAAIGSDARATEDGAPAAGPISFNQDLLEHWWGMAERTTSTPRPSRGGIESESSDASTRAPRFDDPVDVLRYVLERIGPTATVYPTEQYYYFRFDLGVRRVNGNLRFIDAQDGVLHVGYFDSMLEPGEVRSASFDMDDGVEVVADEGSSVVRVRLNDTRVAFTLDRTVLDGPAPNLCAGESVVSPILDESGHSFDLIYYEPERMFYYVRSNVRPAPEDLIPFKTDAGHTVRVGRRSRMVFFHDDGLERDILVGVRMAGVRDNSYFDGPFDQVPPRLDLRDRLTAAYPYVAIGPGIDQHGNFLNVEHQRVAIAAYQQYESLATLTRELDALYRGHREGVERWCMMAYEWKRDFHRSLAGSGVSAGDPDAHRHDLVRSRGWPANHWSDLSTRWPDEHGLDVSACEVTAVAERSPAAAESP